MRKFLGTLHFISLLTTSSILVYVGYALMKADFLIILGIDPRLSNLNTTYLSIFVLTLGFLVLTAFLLHFPTSPINTIFNIFLSNKLLKFVTSFAGKPDLDGILMKTHYFWLQNQVSLTQKGEWWQAFIDIVIDKRVYSVARSLEHLHVNPETYPDIFAPFVTSDQFIQACILEFRRTQEEYRVTGYISEFNPTKLPEYISQIRFQRPFFWFDWILSDAWFTYFCLGVLILFIFALLIILGIGVYKIYFTLTDKAFDLY